MPPDVELLAIRFQARQLSRAEWTHEAHLVVGLWHVTRFGAEDALVRLRSGIRALNEANGVANTPTGGYHETITRAYVTLIEQLLLSLGAVLPSPDRDVDADAQVMLADRLADRAVLFDYWTRDRLLSPQAREGWLEPDRAAL